MNDEAALDNLLSIWQREANLGRDLPAAQPCPDRLELVPELERRIDALRQLDVLAQLAAATVPPPPDTKLNTDPNATVAVQQSATSGRTSVWPPIPGYEIIGELGRGGMGVVYKARQAGLYRLVALKMILHGDYADEEQKQRFRREAEAVACLRHPNIVQIHEVGEYDGQPYFALEYCEGGTLRRKLKGGPLAPREAANVLERLARAVDAAHQNLIVYRDLKPDIVLLTADGTPKVTDFGLARKLDGDTTATFHGGLTNTGDVMGTPSYMAPEQARGERVGPPADIYALGVVLYELLTGKPPFDGSIIELLSKAQTAEPAPLRSKKADVPRDLETICLKCLQKEPAARYPSAEALAEDLRRFQIGEPIVARPVGRLERTVKWAKRHPARPGGFAAAMNSAASTPCCGKPLALAAHNRFPTCGAPK